MQGNGCPWYGKCTQDKTAFLTNNYCTSSTRWHNCPNAVQHMREERLKKEAGSEKQGARFGMLRFVITVAIVLIIYMICRQLNLF